MFPDWAVHLSLCAPGLRSEFEHIALVAFARDGIHQLPRIRRIGFGDVAVESCLLHRGRAAEGARAADAPAGGGFPPAPWTRPPPLRATRSMRGVRPNSPVTTTSTRLSRPRA